MAIDNKKLLENKIALKKNYDLKSIWRLTNLGYQGDAKALCI